MKRGRPKGSVNQTPMKSRDDRLPNGARDWPAFTIRLPRDAYDKLTATAEHEGRSRAAQVWIHLREIYGDKP